MCPVSTLFVIACVYFSHHGLKTKSKLIVSNLLNYFVSQVFQFLEHSLHCADPAIERRLEYSEVSRDGGRGQDRPGQTLIKF